MNELQNKNKIYHKYKDFLKQRNNPNVQAENPKSYNMASGNFTLKLKKAL